MKPFLNAALAFLALILFALPASAQPGGRQPTADQAGIAWYISTGGEQRGPYSIPDLIGMARDREINTGTRVWTPGMADWRPLGEVPQLQAVIDVLNGGAPSEPSNPPREEPRRPPPPPPAPAEESSEWYIAVGSETRGPFSFDQLCAMAGNGEVKPSTRVYHETIGWQAARDVPQLNACLGGGQPPAPPPQDLDREITDFIIGVWRSERTTRGMQETIQIGYRADGSFVGTQSFSTGGGVPPSVLPFDGTWKVRASTATQFLLILEYTDSSISAVPRTYDTEILDDNTVRTSDGIISRRIN